MIKRMLTGLGLMEDETSWTSRRRHERYAGDNAVMALNGRNYQVRDWSKNGIYIELNDEIKDGAAFRPGDDIDFTLSFHLANGRTIQIQHTGQITRIDRFGIGARFTQPSENTRRLFNRILEDNIASEFTQSQVA